MMPDYTPKNSLATPPVPRRGVRSGYDVGPITRAEAERMTGFKPSAIYDQCARRYAALQQTGQRSAALACAGVRDFAPLIDVLAEIAANEYLREIASSNSELHDDCPNRPLPASIDVGSL